MLNGFRSEIKEHITHEAGEVRKVVLAHHQMSKESWKEIIGKIVKYKGIGFWIKLFCFTIVGIGSICWAIYELLKAVGN